MENFVKGELAVNSDGILVELMFRDWQGKIVARNKYMMQEVYAHDALGRDLKKIGCVNCGCENPLKI